MTYIPHRRVLTRINTLLDAELDDAQAEAVRLHLFSCETCSDELEIWATIRSAVKHAYAPHKAPDTLMARITAEISRLESGPVVPAEG